MPTFGGAACLPAAPSRAEPHALLAATPLFRGAPDASLARLAAAAAMLCLEKGAWLFRRADDCSGLYIVSCGSIAITYHAASGAERIISIARAGESFCEAFVFVGRPWPLSARALEESAVLPLPRAAVLGEIAREPALARCLLRSMSQRLRSLRQDLGAKDLRSAAERLAAYLLEDCAHAAGQPATALLPGKGDLASRLGVSPEHLSRILRKLRVLGLVELDGRNLRILDAARLRAFRE